MLDNPTSSAAKDGQFVVDYTNGTTDTTASLNRGIKTQAACYNPDPTLTTDTNRGFAGQAQLRLSSFIRRFSSISSSESSICGTSGIPVAQSYAAALDVVANNINKAFYVDCLKTAPKTVSGVPQCVVGYVDSAQPNVTPAAPLPLCSAKCCNYFATDDKPNLANDATVMPNPHRTAEIAACSADPDCYCAAPSQVNCGAGGAVAGLWRKGSAAPPAGKAVNFQCQ